MEKNRKICNIILLAITLLLEMIILFVSTNILQGLFLSCVNILSTVLLLWFQKGDKKESMRPIWILVLLLTSLFCIIVLCGWKILPTVTAYLHVKSAIQSLFILFSISSTCFSIKDNSKSSGKSISLTWSSFPKSLCASPAKNK